MPDPINIPMSPNVPTEPGKYFVIRDPVASPCEEWIEVFRFEDHLSSGHFFRPDRIHKGAAMATTFDSLVIDPSVSETSPCVRGTWVTVDQIVTMIVDGYTWSDILRRCPELTEDDIRTCISYAIQQEQSDE
jgi:uncharacterized protein (DUF433 family)